MYAAQGVVDASNSTFKIFLSNLTQHPKRIESNACIGYLSPQDEYEIGEEHALNAFFDNILLKDQRKVEFKSCHTTSSEDSRHVINSVETDILLTIPHQISVNSKL